MIPPKQTECCLCELPNPKGAPKSESWEDEFMNVLIKPVRFNPISVDYKDYDEIKDFIRAQKEASYAEGRESLKPLIGTFELKRLEMRFEAGKREGLYFALDLYRETHNPDKYIDQLETELSKLK